MGNHQWDIPVLLAKKVASSGHVSDLAPLEVGIFDAQTGFVATATGNGKEFFLGMGSPHTKDQLTKFYGGMRDPKISSYFMGKDLLSFEKSYPQVPRNEEWVFGYGGSDDDKGLTFVKGEKYQLRIRLYGDPILKKFNKNLYKIITLDTVDCPVIPCEGCAAQILDPKATAKKLIDQINKNVELQEFKLKAALISDDFVTTTPNSFIFELGVVDNGDADGLFAVQRAYTGGKAITRKSYSSGRSVYEWKGIAAAPGAFTGSQEVLLQNCGTCPAGFTTQAAFDTWVVSRQLSAGDDVTGTADQATYAAAIVTAYGGITGSGRFLGVEDGTARVSFNIAAGTAVSPVAGGSDTVSKTASTPAKCVSAAPTAVNWVQSGAGYRVTRTLTAVLPKKDCAVNRTVAELNAYLLSYPSYVSGSAAETSNAGDICAQVFTIQQRSSFMQDACQTVDNADFSEDVIVVDGVAFKPVPAAVTPSTVKVGIRFSAPFFSVKFNDASYNPLEFYDSEPIRMEISVYNQEGEYCKFGGIESARRVTTPRYRNLDGNFVRKQIIKDGAYFTYSCWSQDPRMREVIDNVITDVVSRDKYYVAYYLKFKESREKDNFNEKGQIWEPVIFVEANDQATQFALEAALQGITNKFDVTLQKRGA